MTKLNRLSRPDLRIPLQAVCFASLSWAAGCATGPDTGALVDPLKQRLLAREDIALQNLLLVRTPSYSYAPSGGAGRRGAYSYLDAPYDGPAIEPPLPDLNLLPEDMPPWEEFPEETPAPEPQPTPMEPVPTGDEPAPTPAPTPEATPEPTPEATAIPDGALAATPAPAPETTPAAEPPPAP